MGITSNEVGPERLAARRQIIPLTGVRGLACVWVLLIHAYLLLRNYRAVGECDPLFRGYLGVDLFFVLSGFVLAMTYGPKFASPRLEYTKHFYLGRAFRILPLHWTVLVAFAAATPFMNGIWWMQTPHSLRAWLAQFFLVQTWIGLGQTLNTPAWSLSAEWSVYSTFPALAWATWRIHKGWQAALITITSLAMLTAVTFARKGFVFYGDPSRLGLLWCATEILAGMMMFRLVEIVPDVRRWGWIILIAGFALLAGAMSFKKEDGRRRSVSP